MSKREMRERILYAMLRELQPDGDISTQPTSGLSADEQVEWENQCRLIRLRIGKIFNIRT